MTKTISDERALEILKSLEESDYDPSDHTRRVLKAAEVVPINSSVKKLGSSAKPKKTGKDLKQQREMLAQEFLAGQAEFIDRDGIVKSARNRSTSLETLRLVKERLAMIIASLEFQCIDMQKRGMSRDIPQILSRQVTAIREVANIELQISQFQASTFNLKDERLQKIFALLVETFRDVAKEMLPPEQFDLLWNRLETTLEGWEDRAESITR